MKYILSLCLICSAAFSLTTWATTSRTIYKTILPNGEVLYSGSAEPGSEEIKMNITQTTAKNPSVNTPGSSTVTPTNLSDPNTLADKAPLQYQISFSAPKNEQLYGVGEPDIPIHLQTTPALHPTDRIQLFIDGKAYGVLQSELDYTLSNLDRGTHTLQAKVYSEKKTGDSKGETGVISIHIFKPTVHPPV